MKRTIFTLSALSMLLVITAVQAVDFELWNYEHLDVDSNYNFGYLYHFSSADILEGGSVDVINGYNDSSLSMYGGYMYGLYAYDNSSAGIFGGNVYNNVRAYNSSNVTMSNGNVDTFYSNDDSDLIMSGGNIDTLYARQNSSVAISGGSIERFDVQGSGSISISNGFVSRLNAQGSVVISGGNLNWLYSYENSSIILNGYDFELGSGLSWDVDGQTILGTGTLGGKWFGETERWAVNISENAATASLMAIVVPEPSLLMIGLLGLLKINRR